MTKLAYMKVQIQCNAKYKFIFNEYDKETTYTQFFDNNYPANIYLFKINNRDTRKRCPIYSTLTIEIPD